MIWLPCSESRLPGGPQIQIPSLSYTASSFLAVYFPLEKRSTWNAMWTRSLIKISNQFVKGSIPTHWNRNTFGQSWTEGLRHSWGNKATHPRIRTTTTATATKQFCLSLVSQGSLASLFHHLLPWRFFKLAIGSGFFQARLVLKASTSIWYHPRPAT